MQHQQALPPLSVLFRPVLALHHAPQTVHCAEHRCRSNICALTHLAEQQLYKQLQTLTLLLACTVSSSKLASSA
jgi:hypothetical protein